MNMEQMDLIELVVDSIETAKPATAEIIELTVDELGEVGGGVAYVFL
jgi:hypothetical protein